MVLDVLNHHLLTRTFLVGERISLADICVACTLIPLYVNVLDPNFRKPFANVNRWFTTLINQKEFTAVIGELNLCSKVAEVDYKKFAQLQQQSAPAGKGFFYLIIYFVIYKWKVLLYRLLDKILILQL